MKKSLLGLLCALFALFVAACGPDGANSNGSGGSGNATTTGTGGNGNSSNGGGGAGGGVNICHPSHDDTFITADPSCDACTCNETYATSAEFCQNYLNVDGIDLCPASGNTCAPGVNMCGYDLPEGMAYALPDQNCRLFLLGDTWIDENFHQGAVGTWPPPYDENGQLHIAGLIGPWGANYAGTYVMVGRRLLWNLYNVLIPDVATSSCTISTDCMTIDCVYSPTGESHTFWWLSHPGP